MRDLEGVSQASCDSCLILVQGGKVVLTPDGHAHICLDMQSVMSKRDEEWRLCFKGQLRGPPCVQ